ncbi:hypothetical protein GYB62_02720, partial [bacterium]|nr:hypothetical protein [bacterium]
MKAMININTTRAAFFGAAITFGASAYAGPFAPAAGQVGSTAIAAGSADISAWASAVLNYTPGSDLSPDFTIAERGLGEAGNSDGNNIGYVSDIVSLGRGGSITLTFD